MKASSHFPPLHPLPPGALVPNHPDLQLLLAARADIEAVRRKIAPPEQPKELKPMEARGRVESGSTGRILELIGGGVALDDINQGRRSLGLDDPEMSESPPSAIETRSQYLVMMALTGCREPVHLVGLAASFERYAPLGQVLAAPFLELSEREKAAIAGLLPQSWWPAGSPHAEDPELVAGACDKVGRDITEWQLLALAIRAGILPRPTPQLIQSNLPTLHEGILLPTVLLVRGVGVEQTARLSRVDPRIILPNLPHALDLDKDQIHNQIREAIGMEPVVRVPRTRRQLPRPSERSWAARALDLFLPPHKPKS